MDRGKILIAFRDDDEIKAFNSHLSKLGYDIVSVKDGAHALETSIQDVPALIITDFELPVVSGEKLFQILRNNPHTSKIPFLFISNGIADIKGFRTGVDIFLLRPLNLEELYGRIRQALSIKGGHGGANKEIEGKLSHMSLADIIQFLHLNKKEGELRISTSDATGSVLIKDGEIYNAVTGGVEKEKALFRLLQWTDGKFEFIPKQVNSVKKIRSSTGNTLMEGMRQIDEVRKSREQFPDESLLLRPKVESTALPKGLQPVIYEVMQLTKNYPKVEDIVEKSSYTDYEAYKTISSLLSRGILEEFRPESETNETIEFLTPDQAISIREKILSRFNDMFNLTYGKILVLSTSGAANAALLDKCRKVPGFSLNQRSAIAQVSLDNPLGEAGVLKLYGGMDLIFFSVPTVRNMGPLWKAFSSNLVGMIIVWDEEGVSDLKEIAAAKKDVHMKKRVPSVHIYAGSPQASGNESDWKKTLNLRIDEPIFKLGGQDRNMIFEVFYTLFGAIIKDEYVA